MASVYTHGDNTKSLVQYKDGGENYQLRDHSYYGMGCSNSWGEEGANGSDIPCTTRIVSTINDGDQKNGTYYHYQAASSGSGGAVTVLNTNSHDTFCPLGWQLPYSGRGGDYYDKSKSWRYLFNTYSFTNSETSATKLRSYPLSYVLSGRYAWETGLLYNQGTNALYWSTVVSSGTGGFRLNSWNQGLYYDDAYNKSDGYALRCDCRISN